MTEERIAELQSEWKRYTKKSGGAGTVRDFAEHIVKGFLTADEKAAWVMRGITEQIRTMLKHEDARGVPFAQPLYEEGQETPFWKQLDLFSPQETAALIESKLEGIRRDFSAVLRIRDWAVEKYGAKNPAIQQILFRIDHCLEGIES